MLGSAARRLVNQFRIVPGERAVVVTADDLGIDAACDLAEAGMEVAAVADLRDAGEDERLAMYGIEHLTGFAPVEARGRKEVTGLVVARGSERQTISADTVVMSGGTVAQWGLLVQAGGTVRYDRARRVYVPERVPDGLRVVGEAVGTERAVPAKAEGARGTQFVCYCEDVTTKDVHLSVSEGFASLELSKRYTTVTMGPCQGKMCHRNSGLLMARELGVDPDEERVGVTTARPPHNPTSFSLLAARGYEPEKRTAIHHWHAEHGAKMLWAGDWKRPYDYGGAEDETAAVHESLGLIDVSTLGKLIVRGPEAAAFLERIYPNRYGDMKLARVRYGIVCGDDGSILLRHRKLVPTNPERMIWAPGDAAGLRVVETPIGRLGGLICWENYMPLARFALYESGVEIYVASTADDGDSWQATLRHIALESRSFVIAPCHFQRASSYPDDFPLASLLEGRDILGRGGSAILGPDGSYLAGPLWDEPGILTATLDPARLDEERQRFDPAGHYHRPDVLTLTVTPNV
jgi:predicted amidohydrolase/bacterioferritin-associated ferredoxin